MIEHPTLLKTGGRATIFSVLHMPEWAGRPEEKVLPHHPSAYVIEQVQPDWWTVNERTGTLIYSGLGPVAVLRSPTPF